MHQRLGGVTARTADTKGPQGCPIPCGSILSNKSGRSWLGGATIAQEQAGHHSVGGEQLHNASPVFFFSLLTFPFFLSCPTVFHLIPQILTLFPFSILSLIQL